MNGIELTFQFIMAVFLMSLVVIVIALGCALFAKTKENKEIAVGSASLVLGVWLLVFGYAGFAPFILMPCGIALITFFGMSIYRNAVTRKL